MSVTAWDPTLLLVDALRKIGPDASAAALHAYLLNLAGWVGANGTYDFRSFPQRGLGANGVLMVKWDPERSTLVGASKFGGASLGR